MKMDWTVFQEKRCFLCLNPFYPKSCAARSGTGFFHIRNRALPHGTDNTFSTPADTASADYARSMLCPACAEKIREKTSGYCQSCGEILADAAMTVSRCGACANKTLFWDTFSFFAEYDGLLRELILNAKFRQNRAAAKFLGGLLALFLCKKFPDHGQFNIIPMPLHEKRLIDRGYNQCLEILKFSKKFLSAQTNNRTIAIHKDIVRKKFFTVPQSTLNKKERQKNIKHSFAVRQTDLKEIFLFDDIATTGSTLQEVCRELKKQGAEKIHVIVLARTAADKTPSEPIQS